MLDYNLQVKSNNTSMTINEKYIQAILPSLPRLVEITLKMDLMDMHSHVHFVPTSKRMNMRQEINVAYSRQYQNQRHGNFNAIEEQQVEKAMKNVTMQ